MLALPGRASVWMYLTSLDCYGSVRPPPLALVQGTRCSCVGKSTAPLSHSAPCPLPCILTSSLSDIKCAPLGFMETNLVWDEAGVLGHIECTSEM